MGLGNTSHGHYKISTVFVKTSKVSFADDISNPSNNKETKQSSEFHFLWFMKAATAKQQGSTLLGQSAYKNNGEEKNHHPLLPKRPED